MSTNHSTPADLDDNGVLEVDDLAKLLGDGYDEDQIKRILSEADYGEKDGKIDLAEFKLAITGTALFTATADL